MLSIPGDRICFFVYFRGAKTTELHRAKKCKVSVNTFFIEIDKARSVCYNTKVIITAKNAVFAERAVKLNG